MAKKVWVSLPLIPTTDPADAMVGNFLKGGQRKTLEIETAAFVTKWCMDNSIPFSIDFESATVERNLVMEALPKRLQKILGHLATPTALSEAASSAQGEPLVAAEIPVTGQAVAVPTEETVRSEATRSDKERREDSVGESASSGEPVAGSSEVA